LNSLGRSSPHALTVVSILLSPPPALARIHELRREPAVIGINCQPRTAPVSRQSFGAVLDRRPGHALCLVSPSPLFGKTRSTEPTAQPYAAWTPRPGLPFTGSIVCLPQPAETRNTHIFSQTQCNLLDGSATRTLASVAGRNDQDQAHAGNQYCNLCTACQWLGRIPATACTIGWRETGQWGSCERCIRRLEARRLQLLSPLRSSCGQQQDVCRTTATAISAAATNSLAGPFCAILAATGSFEGHMGPCRRLWSRGNFPFRMRTTTNMHSCGRRRQRLARWRDYRVSSRHPAPMLSATHAHQPEVPCFWTRMTTSLLLSADGSMTARGCTPTCPQQPIHLLT
jgi:hypothetical protein